LSILVLANNKLSGKIPISIGSLTQITALNLGSNSLSQELPSSLKRCTNLVALNVGENRLFGPMPTWIGESLPNVVILTLRSNHFFGSIPSNLCQMSHLNLLDLSSNNISGSIPKCLNNLTAMKAQNVSFFTTIDHDYSYGTEGSATYTSYDDQVQLVWKGTLSVFRNTLGLVRTIDLSNNKLTGEIPTEITELVELVSLNLSRNSLSGEIPSKIGRLKLLDNLDLSNNRLSGQVPLSLSQVDRLGRLDLSNNNLSGKIPISTQLQSFDVSSYAGNSQLCGAPLPKSCPGDEPTITSKALVVKNDEDQDKLVTTGFYVSLGLGFLVGLWGFCGTLLFNKT
ncbi:receptor-like protein EIX2, partial [Cannabis sativa]|uniref:receptor-like protein EIX2 n=1 Tax=Cannabis sativa TaxID=3483 RepID=UPI0029CA1919